MELTKKHSCGDSSDSHSGNVIAVMSSNLHFQEVHCGYDSVSSLGYQATIQATSIALYKIE